jgi:hypothetical protein
MKFPLAQLKPVLIETTERARAAYADTALKLETVREKMTEAANNGRSAVRIALEMNVLGTPAAHRLEAWAETEGFTLLWVGRLTGGGNAPVETIQEPEIGWMEGGIR